MGIRFVDGYPVSLVRSAGPSMSLASSLSGPAGEVSRRLSFFFFF